MANKKFTAIKNDYCITFGYETEVNEVKEEDREIVAESFSFTPLAEIENIIQQCTVDVIGVILDVGPVQQLQLKDGTSRDKRALMIGDETNFSIGLTLWGAACECREFNVGDIAAFQNCRVSEWNGKSLNGSGSPSDITSKSSHGRFKQLEAWLRKQGGDVSRAKTEMKALSVERSGGGGSGPVCSIAEMEAAVLENPAIMHENQSAYYQVHCFCSWVFVP